MKKLAIMTFLGVLFATAAAVAQTPVPDPDTVANPVQQGDPALRTMPPRLDYVEDLKKITADELPEAVKQTLESNARYREWNRGTFYHDENKDEYIVELRDAERTTSQRFDKEGRPIVKQH